MYFKQGILCTKCTLNKTYFTYDVHSVYFNVDWVTVWLRHRHVLFPYDEVFCIKNVVVFCIQFCLFNSTHLARLVMSPELDSVQEHFNDTHIRFTLHVQLCLNKVHICIIYARLPLHLQAPKTNKALWTVCIQNLHPDDCFNLGSNLGTQLCIHDFIVCVEILHS